MKKVYIGSDENNGNKSSRFLEEIIYTKTRNVLLPIVTSGIVKDNWLEKIKQVLGYKKIINNIKLYLNSLGENELRKEVDSLAINVIEEEFSYKYAYNSKRKIMEYTEINSSESGEVNPWDNVRVK